MVRKVVLYLLLAILWIPISTGLARDAFAADEFATSYDVTYDVGADGVTTVNEKITLRNLTSQYYASEFKLTIGATQISDIKAFDPAGTLEVNSEQQNTSTLINVKFNQQVVGLDKALTWTLQYKSKDFALAQGKVWEVTLPKVTSSLRLDDYRVALSVPTSFGEPSAITPAPVSQLTSGGKMILTFDKQHLKNSGVSATFGNHQLYDFDLSYHLENDALVPILTNIALPPDTAYQDVIYKSIEPRPLNVTVDEDGNYLAWYRLDRDQRITVKALGAAKIYNKSKATKPYLDPKLKEKYTQSNKYWEKDNPAIKAKLDEILKSNPTASGSAKVKLIYDFVVQNLKYDTARVTNDLENIERLGAVAALNNPTQAVCMEFTDLFIALARAAGIPARELDGYAYTSNSTLRPLSLNKDILHAWPEYWDEERGWVMVDPTWENTTQGVDYFNKLDLSHFTFVIKGSSSEQPVPAGSYKFVGEDGKDINITLSQVEFLSKAQPEIQIEANDQVIAGFPGRFKVKISNLGNSIQPSSTITVKADGLNLLAEEKQNMGPIPPFGYAEFEYNFRTKSFLDNFDQTIEVNVFGQKLTKNVLVKPFLVFGMFPIVIIGVVVGVVSIYLVILGVFFYRRRFQSAALEVKNAPAKAKK